MCSLLIAASISGLSVSPLTPLTPLTLDLVSQRRLAEVATEELALDALRKLCAVDASFLPLDDVSPYETTFITSSPGTTKIPWWLKMCCEILT